MRLTRIALAIGAATIASAGFAGFAAAQPSEASALTSRIAGGRLEQGRYARDVPRTVTVAQDVTTARSDPFKPSAPPEFVVAQSCPFQPLPRR
jgi:hypothetical protein